MEDMPYGEMRAEPDIGGLATQGDSGNLMRVIKRLSRAIDSTGREAEVLENRLSSVMNPEMESANKIAGEPVPPQSALAGALTELAMQLERHQQRLARITSRLDI